MMGLCQVDIAPRAYLRLRLQPISQIDRVLVGEAFAFSESSLNRSRNDTSQDCSSQIGLFHCPPAIGPSTSSRSNQRANAVAMNAWLMRSNQVIFSWGVQKSPCS